MNKKTKSSQIHHAGAAAQQLFEQAEAINKNGVAIQWTIQVKLAIAPIKSDFCFSSAITESNYLPQHFLNLFPLPQGHGLFLPTFGFVRTYVAGASQQLESLQQEVSWFIFLSDIFCIKLKYKSNIIFIKRNLVACNKWRVEAILAIMSQWKYYIENFAFYVWQR